MRRVFAVLLAFIPITGAFSQAISFYAEELTFTLQQDWFDVEGTYFFRNNTPDTVRQLVFYPLPVADDLGLAGAVEAECLYPLLDAKTIAGQTEKGAHFRLKINPNDTAVYKISYRQQITSNKAVYILTSTKKWKTPLEKSVIKLNMPMNLAVTWLSYDADSIIFENDRLVYKWLYTDFMPENDFELQFKEVR
ncbi:MAG: hypothetical protein JXA03_07645 [Bacteroidales bacterium]|nr:hypothetical protein [Bacteroidales bacterium]